VKGRATDAISRTDDLSFLPVHWIQRGLTMLKITVIAAALGFLAATTLPAVSAPVANGIVKTDLSAAKKKKAKAKKVKKSELTSDLSAAKKKKAKAKKEKKSELTSDLSAAKKKKAKAKKEKKSEAIVYQIAA
jgi:hypothetical protein